MQTPRRLSPPHGVALDLAKARARNISHLRYELALSVPAARAQPVTGTNVLPSCALVASICWTMPRWKLPSSPR
jgi:hypothetical protein